MYQHSQADHGNYSFSNNMTVSDLSYALAEVPVFIQKGSHTPDSRVPLKYLQLHGMTPSQDASKQGRLDLPTLLICL